MDTDDDGQVSKVELEVWLLRVEDNTHRREAATMFDKEDRNKDGFITFNEYWQNEEDDGETEGRAIYSKGSGHNEKGGVSKDGSGNGESGGGVRMPTVAMVSQGRSGWECGGEAGSGMQWHAVVNRGWG